MTLTSTGHQAAVAGAVGRLEDFATALGGARGERGRLGTTESWIDVGEAHAELEKPERFT
ncbi:MAG: hypothetical protein U0235_28060 [Polyangiaceae bacterium]